MLIRNVKPLYHTFFAALLSLALISCDKDDDDDDDNNNNNTYQLSGNASGAQEVPAVTTTASGSIEGSYDADDNTLSYTIDWNGLSAAPAATHFHGPAAVGVGAGVALPITLPAGAGTTGSVNATATLTETQEADLLAGRWYYNIHTPNYPDGEIRGQVAATR